MAADDVVQPRVPDPKIPADQWELPVSFDPAQGLVSLRDYKEGRKRALKFSSLTEKDRYALAFERVKMQPKFLMGAIGAGRIDHDRALNEMGMRTRLGRRIAEIEIRIVKSLLKALDLDAAEND